jgi:cobaltochelatase CobT
MDAIRKARAILGALPYVVRGIAERMDITVRVSHAARTASTDGRRITLPPLPLPTDQADVETVEGLADLAYGYCYHEIGHILRTDFGVYEEAGSRAAILARLLNALEDPWQEQRMIEAEPGVRARLNALFDRLVSQGRICAIAPDIEPARAVNGYAMLFGRSVVRNQARATELVEASRPALVERFGEPFVLRMETLIEIQLPNARNTREIYALALRIQQAMEEEAQRQEQAGSAGNDASKSGDSSDDGSDADDSGDSSDDGSDASKSGDSSDDGSDADDSGDSSDDGSDAGDSGDSSDDGSDADDSGDSSDGGSDASDSGDSSDDGSDAGDSGDSSDGGSDASDSTEGRPGKGSGGDDGKKIADALREALSDPDKTQDTNLGNMIQEALTKAIEALQASGQVQAGLGEFDYAEKDPRKRVVLGAHPVDVDEVAASTAELTRKLMIELKAATRSEATTRNRGRRLDPRKLHRLAADDARIFRHVREGRSVDAAVALLVDVSGSMGWGYPAPIGLARQAVLAAALAIEAIPKATVCVGTFPGDGLVIDFGERARYQPERFALATHGGTPLAEAIAWMGPRLALRREQRKLLMVLTDGEPNNSAAAAAQIEILAAQGVDVCGIGINSDAGRAFFPRWQMITDVAQLPDAVLTTLRQRLMDALVA